MADLPPNSTWESSAGEGKEEKGEDDRTLLSKAAEPVQGQAAVLQPLVAAAAAARQHRCRLLFKIHGESAPG